MKTKISVSIEEDILENIKETLEEGIFRNKSHLIEYATKKFLGEREKC
jgi:Arc/MetJ-type ribon-helix-helix transcriptional regulator